MTLYLKYRPQKIEDLDLESVRVSLSKILGQPDTPHAFLFSGPKGTGKTSAARIVAKAINCETKKDGEIEPCGACSTCLSITKGENMDVIEIDAASHRGIDDIRSLREAVKLSPTSSKKKVYIIDEAHMLTTEACNALLKVLEEPPSHVIFILATTNPEKLIDTIRSRTTLVSFTKATEDDIVRRLLKVAEGENVQKNDEVLKLIAKAADGAFRDAVKLFEQILLEQIELTPDSISNYLFGKKSFDPNEFTQKLLAKDAKTSIEMIEKGCVNGVSAKTMAKGVLDVLRAQLLDEITHSQSSSKEGVGIVELIELFSDAYKEIPGSYIEQLPLEIAVVKWCGKERIMNYDLRIKNENQKPQIQSVKNEEKEDPEPVKKDESAPDEEIAKFKLQNSKLEETQKKESDGVLSNKDPEVKEPLKRKADTVIENVTPFSDEIWAKVLTEVRPHNASTEALLRSCKPMTFDGKVLTLSVFYKFHKERLEAQPHRDLLEDVLESLLGVRPRVSCMLTDPPEKKVQDEIQDEKVVLTEAKVDTKIVDIAKEIFGS